MKINRVTFYSYVRNAPFGGKLSTDQVNGMNAIINEWELRSLDDIRWLAYMLATAFWETGKTMQPIREANGTSDAQTIKRLDAAWKDGKLGSVKQPYWRDGWFGRGLVQLTHKENYEKMGDILGISLAANPALALDLTVAVDIMFEGMTRGISMKGDFTGKALEDYFNKTTDDPTGARHIINGVDKAKLIASYHNNFLDAIKASMSADMPADASREAAKPDDVKPTKSKSIITTVTTIAAGGGLTAAKQISDSSTSLFQSITSPWAFGAFLVLVGLGTLIWLIASGRITINRK